MEIYKGFILKQFLVDRLAFGLPEQEILNQFQQQYNQQLTLEQLKDYSNQWKEDIKKREDEFQEDLKNNAGTISSRVEQITKTTQSLADELIKSKNYALAERYIANLKNQLELLAKLYGELKQKSENISYNVIQTSNYAAMEMLERDNIIQIKDRKRLKKMLGIAEEMEQYA